MRRPLAALALLLGSATALPALAAPPDVVTTIRPVHSLVAAVMQGVAEPTLLLPPGASPHDYALKPSDAQALSQADVVFWVGAPLEAFLRKPVESLATEARVVALASAPGLTLLRLRSGDAWAEHAHAHSDAGHDHAQAGDHGHEHGHDHDHAKDHDHAHGAHAHDQHHDHAGEDVIPPMAALDADAAELPADVDSHIWLDPRNAAAMGATIAAVLAEEDPENAATYRANAEALTADLAALEATLAGRLAPVQGVPYLVFHDAYHYLEHRFGLSAVGSITVEPGRPVGARRVADLRETVRDLKAACVFAEPQFEPRLVATITEDTQARAGVLDPLGGSLPPGPDLYATLMTDMAEALTGCLNR